ncbi:MAG: PAS domain-containing protein [Acidimicrobiales bacterium]
MEFPDLPEEITALTSAEEAVVVINVEGAVVFMNAPAEKLLGVDAEDMVGEFVEMLVPEGKRWGHQAYRRGYFAEPNTREMDPGLYPEAETPEGELIPIAATLVPIRVGNVLYAAAHITPREPEALPEGEQS